MSKKRSSAYYKGGFKPWRRIDPTTGALYVRVSTGEVAGTLDIGSGVFVDARKDGKVCGVEFRSPHIVFPRFNLCDVMNVRDVDTVERLSQDYVEGR